MRLRPDARLGVGGAAACQLAVRRRAFARGRADAADSRAPSARKLAEARAASEPKFQGPAGDDSIDNEVLVAALAQDILGDAPGAQQLASVYGKNARSLLDA